MRLKANGFFLFFALLFVSMVYSPVLIKHPTLKLDDQELLEPLKKVQSFDDYVELVSKHQILDIQPVRDLTFWVELQIEEGIGFRNSQAVNLVLWFLILGLTYLILNEFFPDSPWNLVLVFILAVHPIATASVAWTAARKHLLSALFILIGTHLSYQDSKKPSWKKRVGILVCFGLSAFSQPINLAWPLWLGFFFYQKKTLGTRRNCGLLLGLGVISAVAAYLNFQYYSGLHSASDSPPKINPESFQNLVSRILVLGRYVFQIVFPVRPVGLPYGLQQWPTYAGFGISVGLILTQWKWKVFRDFKWFLFLILPIVVMTTKLTHHAGFDTYILVSLIGSTFLLRSSMRMKELSVRSFAFSSFLVVCFGLISFGQAYRWTSDENIFAQAYETEKTEFATVGYAKLLLDSKDLEKADRLISELSLGDPANPELPALKGRLFFLKDLPVDQKRELFQRNEIFDPWYQYYFAAFEASLGQYSEAHMRILKSFELAPEKFIQAFSGNEKTLFQNWRRICQAAGGAADCQEIERTQNSSRSHQ